MVYRSLVDWLANKLSRVTSSGEFIPEIDGLRFIAIIAVIFHHLMAAYLVDSQRFGSIQLLAGWSRLKDKSQLVHLISYGYFGVQLFFVISGFILALPFARSYFTSAPGPRLKSYYLRRVTRIEPPYIISLVFFVVYIWITNPGRWVFVPHFIASLLYSHCLVYSEASWINGVSWSLEIEVQFYLLVPLLATVFAVRSPPARRTLLVASILFFGLVPQWLIAHFGTQRLYLTVLNFLQYFLAGFLLADLYLTASVRERATAHWWDVVVVLSVIIIMVILARFPDKQYLLPFVIALFYLGIFLGRISNAIIRLGPIVILGGICYTTYLYHWFVIGFVSRAIIQFTSLGRPLWRDFLIYSLIQLVVIFFISAWLFVYTEKPFMKQWRGIHVLKSAWTAVTSPTT